MINAFPKIFAIGTVYIKDIFNEPVEITEKIDGSQFVFGKINNEIHMRSKGAIQYQDKHDKLFSCAVDYVLSIETILPEGVVFYCEYLKEPRHNILKYDRIPKNHLILFGISGFQGQFRSDLVTCARILDIESVPVIQENVKIIKAEEIFELINRESVLGGCNVEGVVVKNYQRPFLLGGQPIPLMAGKYVSERFKETHKENWGKEFTTKGRWLTFVGSFNTEARWSKAVQRMAEISQLENSPRDIGKLIKSIQEDIEAEEKENIQKFLWNENKREIFSRAVKGFPEWYKEQLIKNSFLRTS